MKLLLAGFICLLLVTHFSFARVKPEIINQLPMDNPVVEEINQASELITPEPSYGQLLYENHCLDCHESQLHIRANTRVKSLTQLNDFVKMRALNQALKWGDGEITAVTLFLNQNYYHFSVSQRE